MTSDSPDPSKGRAPFYEEIMGYLYYGREKEYRKEWYKKNKEKAQASANARNKRIRTQKFFDSLSSKEKEQQLWLLVTKGLE